MRLGRRPARGRRARSSPGPAFYLAIAIPRRYGKYLLITVIEPDYDQEEGRYTKIEELNYFKMEETNLGKIKHIFDQPEIKLQIAASNRIGMGVWVKYNFKPTMKKPREQ